MMKRLSRSDSRNRFFSQERLSGDLDYEIHYRSDSPKKFRDDHDGLRRMKIRSDARDYIQDDHRYVTNFVVINRKKFTI
mgnify:CR=1 FL=1